jgi:hypothetical protein
LEALAQQLSSLLPLAFGIVLGWFAHRLTSVREREARSYAAKVSRDERLADYEAFLLEWEQRIERTSPEDIANSYFAEGAAAFRSRAARVRRCFDDREAFNRLDDGLARLSPGDLFGQSPKTSRDVLADAVRAVIRHVRAA